MFEQNYPARHLSAVSVGHEDLVFTVLPDGPEFTYDWLLTRAQKVAALLAGKGNHPGAVCGCRFSHGNGANGCALLLRTFVETK